MFPANVDFDCSLLLQGLSESAALLLGYLRQESKGEWVSCSGDKVFRAINMNSFRQVKYLQELLDAGLIEVERRGFPCSRWVCTVEADNGQLQGSQAQVRPRTRKTHKTA